MSTFGFFLAVVFVLVVIIASCVRIVPVSYTHLTLPTKLEV